MLAIVLKYLNVCGQTEFVSRLYSDTRERFKFKA